MSLRTASWASGPRAQTLFAFHHAGGSSRSYQTWTPLMPTQVGFAALELAGHDTRMNEPLPESIEQIAAEFASSHFVPESGMSYVLFGHSMGGLIAHATAVQMQRLNLPTPNAIVVSACRPPTSSAAANAGDLTDQELIDHVSTLGGTPAGVFDEPDLRDLLLPILRHDLKLAAAYQPEPCELDIPLLALVGRHDQEAPYDTVVQWQQWTSRPLQVTVVNAGHFYLESHAQQVTQQALRHLLT